MASRRNHTTKRSWQLGAALILGALACSGCQGGVDTEDGKGGDGGAAATGPGSGGSGGGGATDNAGGTTKVGENAVVSAALCEAMCHSGSCVNNVCTEPEQLAINAFESDHVDQSGAVVRTAKATACAHAKYVSAVHALAADGPCFRVDVETLEGDHTNLPVDVGSLSVNSPTAGDFELLAQGACLSTTVASGKLFTAGDVMTAEATGSGDVKAFALQALAPETFTLTTSPLHAGQPFTVSWDSEGALSYVLVLTASTTLFCQADAKSELTISGALTEAIGPDSGVASVVAVRLDSSSTDMGSAGAIATFTVSSVVQADVPYSP